MVERPTGAGCAHHRLPEVTGRTIGTRSPLVGSMVGHSPIAPSSSPVTPHGLLPARRALGAVMRDPEPQHP